MYYVTHVGGGALRGGVTYFVGSNRGNALPSPPTKTQGPLPLTLITPWGLGHMGRGGALIRMQGRDLPVHLDEQVLE